MRGASHYERGLLGIFGSPGAIKAAPGTHSRVSSERGVAVQASEAKPQHGQGRGVKILQGTQRIRLHPLHHPPGLTLQGSLPTPPPLGEWRLSYDPPIRGLWAV